MRAALLLCLTVWLLAGSVSGCRTDKECCAGAQCIVPRGGTTKKCVRPNDSLCPPCPEGQAYSDGKCQDTGGSSGEGSDGSSDGDSDEDIDYQDSHGNAYTPSSSGPAGARMTVNHNKLDHRTGGCGDECKDKDSDEENERLPRITRTVAHFLKHRPDAQITITHNSNTLKHKEIHRGHDSDKAHKEYMEQMKEESSKQKGQFKRDLSKEQTKGKAAREREERLAAEEQDSKKAEEQAHKDAVNEERTKAANQREEDNTEFKNEQAKAEEQHAKKMQISAERAAKKLTKQKLQFEKQREANEKQMQKEKAKSAESSRKQLQEEASKASSVRLSGGWSNYGGSYSPARAGKSGDLCVLSGLVRGSHGLVATLPHRCRPHGGRLIFTAMKGGTNARVDVLRSGAVYVIAGGGSHWLSLDGIVFTPSSHSHVSLIWGWRPYGHGYRSPSLYQPAGLCALSGLIRSGRLPYFASVSAACRPDRRLIFSGNNHAHITRVDLVSSGHVLRAGGYFHHGWVSLDSLMWFPRGGHDLPLMNGWMPYSHGYRGPQYKKVGRHCIVSGLIKSNHWKSHIATLPEQCRPHRRLIFGVNVHMRNARVDVLRNGAVVYVNGKMHWNWLSLDGIQFLTT